MGPEDRRDTVDRMSRRLVQVAIALWALAEALFLVLIGMVAWPLVLGWAVAAVVVGLVAGVLPTGAVRIVAALALLPATRRARAATADLGRLNWANTLSPLWVLVECASMKSRAPTT